MAGKLALAWAYNVECVTFLIILYTAVFGFKRGGAAALIFALTDGLIYGYGYYTLSYIVQFPLVAAATAFLSRKRVRSEYVYTVAAFFLVVFFGLHTALLDHFVLGVPFWAWYASGFLFYAANILSACLLTLFAFKPLYKVLKKQKDIYFNG